MSNGRRAFLRIAGAAGLAGIATPAAAFRILPAEDYAGILDNACGSENAFHRRILSDAEAALGVKLDGPQAEQARLALSSLTCPRCGCGVLAELMAPEKVPF
jgi:hypothetical protein